MDTGPIKTKGVTLAVKAGNLARAVGRMASAVREGRGVFVPPATYEERMKICRACEHWRESGNLGLGECGHPRCGCTRAKQRLTTEKCPLHKW